VGRRARIIRVRQRVELFLNAASFVRGGMTGARGAGGLQGVEATADGGHAVAEGADLALTQLLLVILLLFEQTDGLGGIFEQRDGIIPSFAIEHPFGEGRHRTVGDQVAGGAIQMELAIGFGHDRAASGNCFACYPVAG
jgi:hypothetical protein